MKILIFPILVLLLPIISLLLTIKCWKKEKQFSIIQKIALGIIFFILGLVSILIAMIVSIHGVMDKGISCASGVVIFIPIGLFINLIGIPLILILEKNTYTQRKTKQFNKLKK